MKIILSLLNKSLVLYLLIFAVLYFSIKRNVVEGQRIFYLRVCVHDNFGRINDKTNIIFLDYLTRLKPDQAPYWVRLGVSQFHLEEFEAAAQSYKKAILLDPSNSKYQMDLERIEQMIPK